MDATVRARMESRFGHDFGAVRIHTDAAAAQSASALGAAAFEVDHDIAFAPGEYAPEQTSGEWLLAHELAHIVQRDRAGARGNGAVRSVSDSGDAAEVEARAAATQVVAGDSTADINSTPASLVSLQEKDSWWQQAYDWGGFLSDQVGLGGSVVQGIDDIGTSLASGASTALGGPAISAAEGASLGKITGPLGGITSGIGLVTGLMQAFDPESSTGERVQGGLSATSGGLGVLGSFFPGFAAGGSAGLAAPVGTAFGAGGAAGVGTALGSAGAVLGAGLAGWGAGRGLDNLVDWIGDEVSGDEQADHSISGGLADVMTSVDQSVSSLWADESKPAYTQTLGWKLAEVLPSWMQ